MSSSRFPARVLLATVGLVGCAYRTPPVRLPAGVVPAAAVVVDASEVRVVEPSGRPLDANEADAVRAELARALRAAGGARAPEAAAMRLRGTVTITPEEDFMACGRVDGMGCVVFLPWIVSAFAGVDTDWSVVRLALTLEEGDRAVPAVGEAVKGGGFYASARRRALAAALERAFADAPR